MKINTVTTEVNKIAINNIAALILNVNQTKHAIFLYELSNTTVLVESLDIFTIICRTKYIKPERWNRKLMINLSNVTKNDQMNIVNQVLVSTHRLIFCLFPYHTNNNSRIVKHWSLRTDLNEFILCDCSWRTFPPYRSHSRPTFAGNMAKNSYQTMDGHPK